jgi:predicted DNA-binding mobile mystery protein A
LEDLERRNDALQAAVLSAAAPAKGWLRAVREAVGLTQAQVAAKVGVRRQSLAQFEAAEESGAISLSSLRRAAAGMDCELVYFLVPRAPVASSFGGLARAHDPESAHQSAADHSMRIGGE